MVRTLGKDRQPRKTLSFQKSRRRKDSTVATHGNYLRHAFHWLLGDENIFAKVQFHGNVSWAPSSLVVLALCWSWCDARNLTDAFTEAATWCQWLLGHVPLTTYQGFMGALATWTPKCMPILIGVLQQRMIQVGGKYCRIDGFVAIAFDGSRSSSPRTKSNEKAFCAKNYGQGRTAQYRKKKSKGRRRVKNKCNPAQAQEPQVWMTMLWHMGLRLPWNWELGPSNSCERDHVMQMIEGNKYPANTLFCGDAGFVGYPLWSCIQKAGSKFLVRVGANVSLLSELTDYALEKKKKRQEQFVLCWPKDAQRKNKIPLRLRLVRVYVGKTWMWLLTNVMDWQELSAKMMSRLYKRRWGVEVEFRGLKQTLDRSKLRCRNSKRLLAELNWSILALVIAELLALKEQLAKQSVPKKSKKEREYDPSQRSLANTMRALRGGLKNLASIPEAGKDLASLLNKAIGDGYKRTGPKQARYRPPNPDKKPLGDPNIRSLNDEEQRKLKKPNQQKAA